MKRNANVVTALLGNFDQAEKALETSLNSAGSALKENEKYLESIRGKLDQLSAAWQTLSNNLLDSDLVKLAVDGLRLLLDTLNKLDEATGGFTSALVALASAGVLATSIIGAFKNDLFGLKTLLHLGSVATEVNSEVTEENTEEKLANAAATRAQVSAETRHIGTLTKIGAAIGSFVSTYPIIAIAVACAGVAAAIVGISKAVDSIKLEKAKEAVSSLTSESEQMQAEFDQNAERIKELQDLASNSSINIIEKKELDDLQRKNDLLSEQIKLTKELLEIEQKKVYDAANKAAEEYLGNGSAGGLGMSGSEEVERLLGELSRAQNTLGTFESAPDGAFSDSEANIVRITESLRNYQKELLELMGSLDTSDAVGRAYFNQLQLEYDRISVAIDGADGYADAFNNTLSRHGSAGLILKKLGDTGELTATKLKGLYETSPDDGAIRLFVDELIKIGVVSEEDADKWKLIANFFKDIQVEAAKATQSLIPLESMIGSVTGATDLLTKARKEMKETGYVELDTIKSLVSEYPELEKYLIQTSNGYKLNTEALNDYLAAQEQQYKTAFNEAKSAAISIIEQETNKKIAIDATTESIMKQMRTMALEAQYQKARANSHMIDWLNENGVDNATSSPVYMMWFNKYKAAAKEYELLNDAIQNFETADANYSNWVSLQASIQRESAAELNKLKEEKPDYDAEYKWLVDMKKEAEQNNERMKRMDGDWAKERIGLLEKVRDKAIEALNDAAGASAEEIEYLEDLLWELNDELAEIYENQIDAIQNIIDLTIEMVKENYEDQIDAIEKQTDAYNDLIEAKKKSLKEDKAALDYNRKVAEKSKEIAKITSKIELLKLDDSRESAAERKKLEEELAKLNIELADLQSDRTLEITEDALDASADAYEKANDERVDSLKELLKDEEALYKEAIDKIVNMEQSFYEQLEKWAKVHGEDIRKLADDWEVAKNAKQGYTDLDAAMSGISNNVSNLESTTQDGSYYSAAATAILNQMQKNSKWAKDNGTRYYTDPDGKTIDLHEQNDKLEDQFEALTGIQIEYDKTLGWINSETKKPLYKFHEGGVVGGNGSLRDNEVMSILEKNELVLENGRKMNLTSLFDNLRSTISSLVSANLFDNMSVMRGAVPAAAGNAMAPEINVTIQHNGDMSDNDAKRYGAMVGDEALKKLRNAFTKRGF